MKFEGLTDEEVLDIATTPGIDEELAEQAEQEYARRSSEYAKTALDINEKLQESDQTEAELENTDIEEGESDEQTSTAQTLGGTAFTSAARQKEHIDYGYYEDLYGDTQSKQKVRSRMDNPEQKAKRDLEREKDARNSSNVDKRDPENPNTEAFYRTVQSEGAPNRERHEYTTPEILKDAETQIRNHYEDFLLQGLMIEYRNGNKTPNQTAILYEQYSNFIDKRAWTYGLEDDGDDRETIREIKQKARFDIIPKIVSEADPSRFEQFRRDALVNLIKQGVRVETDEFGNREATYSLPDSFVTSNEQVKKFAKRYGSENVQKQPAAEFLKDMGIDCKEMSVQNASFHGFIEIAKALSDSEQPDVSKLDWYFNTFDYANHDTMARFVSSLETTRSIDPGTQEFISNYLSSKPEYQEYLASLDSDEAIEEEQENLNPAGMEFFSGEEALRRLCEEFNISFEEIENLNLKAIEGDILNESGPFGDFRGNTTFRTGEDTTVEFDDSSDAIQQTFSPKEHKPRKAPEGKVIERQGSERLGEDYARMKALYMAILYLKVKQIDPQAELGFPGKKVGQTEEGEAIILENRSYLLLRFGCESTHKDENGNLVTEHYNHAIAESTGIVGATYVWYGHGENWKQDLKGKPDDVRRRENVDRVIHSGKRSLSVHLSEALYKLGVPYQQIIAKAS